MKQCPIINRMFRILRFSRGSEQIRAETDDFGPIYVIIFMDSLKYIEIFEVFDPLIYLLRTFCN